MARRAFLAVALLLCGVVVAPVAATVELGCYEDFGASRQMRYQQCEPCANLSLKWCADTCASKGYPLAGVEAGHQCFCDSEVANATAKVADAQCDTACNGNDAERCGGYFRVWVYNSSAPQPPDPGTLDPRDISNGTVMLATGYLDQPYCVQSTGRSPVEWTCIVTDGAVHEGGSGEHMVAVMSTDKGKTWSSPVLLEQNTTLDNAYGTIVISPRNRIYCIYNMNLDNITHLPDGKPLTRVDELGHFVMRSSDDAGRTWSDRVEVPYRLTPLDQNNSFGGKVKTMWCVDQVKIRGGRTYHAFTKIGTYVQSAPQEVWILSSPNLLQDPPLADITWDLLPNGDHGILPPGGNPDIMEEGHIIPLLQSEGFYVVGRTAQGFLAATYTTDSTAAGGWVPTSYAQYWNQSLAPAQIVPMLGLHIKESPSTGVKNVRGPITPKVMSNGMYLLLYYNDHATTFGTVKGQRNPYWLASGIEAQGQILWSQPEVIIYNKANLNGEGGGYPDFIEDTSTGKVYITETQKSIARIHEIPDNLLQGLFSQHKVTTAAVEGLALTIKGSDQGSSVDAPHFTRMSPYTVIDQGLTIELHLEKHSSSSPGNVLLSSVAAGGPGVLVTTTVNNSITFSLFDDAGANVTLRTGATCTSMLQSPGRRYVAFVADAGPPLATVMVDGFLCDGGAVEAAGFTWFSPTLGDINGSPSLAVGPSYTGTIGGGRVYTRMLRTSELVGNYRSGTSRQQ